MKLAPVVRALRAEGTLPFRIVHTGQHYDEAMTDVFFAELGIPSPDVHLEVGSGSHGAQTARILERVRADAPRSRGPRPWSSSATSTRTVACALAAVKLGVPVAHVEAGLRSFDRSMPEEINRLLTDAMADLLLVSEASGARRTSARRRAGIEDPPRRQRDDRHAARPARRAARARWRGDEPRADAEGLRGGDAAPAVERRRPGRRSRGWSSCSHELAGRLPLVFPVHPRTLAAAARAGIGARLAAGQDRLVCLPPQPYGANLSLLSDAAVVLTDSGGLQEESAVLDVPCLTLRENTERPVTVELGTSRLVGNDPARIRAAFGEVLDGRWRKGQAIPLWDGKAGARIARELSAWLAA